MRNAEADVLIVQGRRDPGPVASRNDLFRRFETSLELARLELPVD
jgi:hypothetical protein